MPYIRSEQKEAVDITGHSLPFSPGELNYAITILLKNYFKELGGDYRAINDCLGALEGAKLEFYRRVAVPYEDKKRQQNGDVYDT